VTQQEVWDLVLKMEHKLKRAIKRWLPRRRWDELDEMYSACVLARAHQVMSHYDPAKGASPEGHLLRSCVWHAYRWARGTAFKAVPEPMDPGKMPEGSHTGEHEACAQVSTLLCELYEDERRLVEWILLEGFTYEEVAAHTGDSKKRVRRAYQAALEVLRTIADEGPGDQVSLDGGGL
jgi:DNA-directed RNA polymerase specialized sigma24 family protein